MSSSLRIETAYAAEPSSVAAIRHAVAGVAVAAGADEEALIRISLAVSEAATNVILHAYRDRLAAGDIRVAAGRDGDFVRVLVADSGMGMTPRTDSPGLGLGLGLMAYEADGFEIGDRPGGGTEIALCFGLNEAARAH